MNLSAPTGAWDDAGVTDLPTVRGDHASVILNDSLYVLGGADSSFTASVIQLDLSNPAGAWNDAGITDLPTARMLSVAVVYSGSLYFIGGYTTTQQSNTWRLRQNNNPDDAAHRTSLGRTVNIQYPRYGYTSGRPMKIIGTESDLKSRVIKLELWG